MASTPNIGKDMRAGRVMEITSTANPIVKSIRALSQKKHRDESGTFLAEGLKHVIDALDQKWNLKQIIYSKQRANHELTMKVAARGRALGVDILEVSDKVLAAITKRDNPQAVLGVVEQNWHSVDALIAAHKKDDSTLLVLDRVRDPGNLGTIIRTLDGVGAGTLILVGDCTDPFALEAVRASMGSLFHVKLAKCTEAEFLAQRPNILGQLIGTHLEGAVDWRAPEYENGPIALVMGNERAGMSEEMAQACTTLIRIPMAGGADSLNLAVATGLALYEARRHLLSDKNAPVKRSLSYD